MPKLRRKKQKKVFKPGDYFVLQFPERRFYRRYEQQRDCEKQAENATRALERINKAQQKLEERLKREASK